MADLDISALVESMTAAAAGVLEHKGPAVATFAETEFQKIAQTVASIAGQLASHTSRNNARPGRHSSGHAGECVARGDSLSRRYGAYRC